MATRWRWSGQKITLGRTLAGLTIAVTVSDTTLAIELDDQETRVVPRSTIRPVRNIKANRPRMVPLVPSVNHHPPPVSGAIMGA
jgi:hypothetical protein